MEDIVQLVERQIVALDVVGSIPITRFHESVAQLDRATAF